MEASIHWRVNLHKRYENGMKMEQNRDIHLIREVENNTSH